jgi:hypothetical protein
MKLLFQDGDFKLELLLKGVKSRLKKYTCSQKANKPLNA